MLKPVFILVLILSYIGHRHITCGSEMFHIYVVVDQETKAEVLQELTEKYDMVKEQSFFLPNKVLFVAGSKRKTAGSQSKNFLSVEEEINEDVLTFRQKPNVYLTNKIELLERHVRSFTTNDTQWSNMWQINGDISPTMKVAEAWKKGYDGSGIIVSVVDQGLETRHNDLDGNVRMDGHYDFIDNDSDPNPPFNFKHGTRVAGFIAAERDNDICIVGVAYGSKLIGIRLLGSNYTTDISEALALSHGYNVTHISSNSWGPPDSYGYFAPGALTAAAFEQGVTQGRAGKGVIYVWAAGNGGTTDNCNADGYANSIYTVTISSVNSLGQPAWYSEVCASTLAVTYSGDKNQRYMTTTSNGNSCDSGIEGTSFSAPQAAGMVALALEANPHLSWRDVQHLIVMTAKYENLKEAEGYGFFLNGAGNHVGQMFGYGLMDAEAMVRYAETWTTVPQQEICNDTKSTTHWVLNSSLTMTLESLLVSACNIQYLEHVKVHAIFQSSERAYVELNIVSPLGTLSKLMTQRRYDKGVSREQEWTFMSVQFWGEAAAGNWTFSMTIPKDQTGSLTSWQLILYGTSSDPLPGINACNNSACRNGGTCTSSSKYDTYNCTCIPGYTGQLCETDINECASNPCHGVACENLINDYKCKCSTGYFYNRTANQCQDINECESNPCLGNSTCEDLVNGYNCACPRGYTYNKTTGACQDNDECKLHRHQCCRDMDCLNTIGSYTCNCTRKLTISYASPEEDKLSPEQKWGIGAACVCSVICLVIFLVGVKKQKQTSQSEVSKMTTTSKNGTRVHSTKKSKISPYSKEATEYISLEDSLTIPHHKSDLKSLRTSIFYINLRR
ncbi:hypothetical protein CHS0354_027452 [Potamilus streckersoni]|uniref:Uncharacterized protein n=1 Tax=Potamilus streckersoni TaxID=2493646 RepID=A0AAE0T6D9_9BIVA|nr:hypothetical protein CHS0354_027452 [Potamilus streckersoni]